jgi:hypothetical protein
VSARLRVNVCRYRRFHAAEHTSGVDEITRGEHMAKNTWLNEYGGGLRQTDDTNAVPSRAEREDGRRRERARG